MGEALLVRKSGGIATASNVIANPVNSFSISGTYANSTYYDADHSGYAVTPCGDILIYIKTTNTSYENVNFVSTTGLPSYIEIINYDMYTQFSNSFATGENIRMYACLIKGVWSKLLNISVNLVQ
jgi:hypothetical protein